MALDDSTEILTHKGTEVIFVGQKSLLDTFIGLVDGSETIVRAFGRFMNAAHVLLDGLDLLFHLEHFMLHMKDFVIQCISQSCGILTHWP